MNDKRDLIGQKFGKLTVIDYLGFYAKNNTKTKGIIINVNVIVVMKK